MKAIFAMIAVVVGLLSAPIQALAQSGVGVSTQYSTANVSTGAWKVLISQTSKAIKGVVIQDSSGQTMELGYAASTSAANSETRSILIPLNAANLFVPMPISAGKRVSIRAVSGTASSGISNISFIYY